MVNYNEDTKAFECVTVSDDSEYRCPGTITPQCPGNDFDEVDAQDCTQSDELLISSGCNEGFYCKEELGQRGIGLSCPAGQIIDIELFSLAFNCEEDQGQCKFPDGLRIATNEGQFDL